eukprot:XP_001700254.1 predicted protein [Chlamydomonas reinhardtii]
MPAAGSPTVVTQGTTATLYDNGVPSSSLYLTWYPITLASNSNKWGGYYTLPAPPPGSTYSTLTPPPPSLAAAASGLFMCAGCAMNDASKGYFFGGVTLSVTNTGGVLTASCAVALPPAGSPTSQGTVLSSSVQEVHLYASFDIIDTDHHLLRAVVVRLLSRSLHQHPETSSGRRPSSFNLV